MMRQITLAAVTLCVAVIFTACGTKNSNYNALVANEWSLERIVYADSNYSEEPPTVINLVFEDSSKMVFGKAGCNNLRSPFTTTEKDQLKFGNIASTMMWCPNMEFEDRYTALLSKVTTYDANEHELILKDADGKFKMHYLVRVKSNEAATRSAIEQAEGVVEGVIEEGIDGAGAAIKDGAAKVDGLIEDGKRVVDGVVEKSKEVVDKTKEVTKEVVDKTKEAGQKVVEKSKETADIVKKELDK